MRSSSLLTNQISGGRGHFGARKLIPLLKISRARQSDRASQHQQPRTND